MTLSKHFSFQEGEKKWLKKWSALQSDGVVSREDLPPFVIMMPPPNVTGHLHIGHALTYTLQDVLVRYHRMKGHEILWQPGTDHAGIATQMVVEKKLAEKNMTRQELGREKFLEEVWAWKDASGSAIVHQQERLGITPNWDRSRFTMDPELSKSVVHAFVTLYDQGLIYKDKRLVNWDVVLETAVSDLEVKTIDTPGTFYDIAYPLVEDPFQSIVIATTRPETLFGDVAIAVHPEDQRYRGLVGKHVRVPLTDRTIPIIADDYADPDKGTGAVKITPSHDFNDFEVGKRHHLDHLCIFNPRGHLNDRVPKAYENLDRFAARKAVVRDLEDQGFLRETRPTVQPLPFSERSQTLLEPYLTDQWFLNPQEMAKKALDVVEQKKITLFPDHWVNTYRHWLDTIQPWCISRQLWWGHEIPAWYGPDDRIFVAASQEEAQKKAQDHYGKPVDLRKETDVLDTWFSSALWPFATLGWPHDTHELQTFYPTSVLITGTDILFFWVARMVMMGLTFMEDIPFRHVFLHALVRDSKGQKMSKSKGNVLDPLVLIDQHGTDALRFSLMALTIPGRDIRFSEAHVEKARHFGTKLWNAARFAQHYACDYDPDFSTEALKLDVNHWILDQFNQTREKIQEALSIYRFDDAAKEMYAFVWGTYCDWYLELAKPFLMDGAGPHTQETQKMVAHILVGICHVLHPVMPFITEEIHQAFAPHSPPLMHSAWPRGVDKPMHGPTPHPCQWVIETIEKIRSIKALFQIPGGKRLRVYIEQATDLAKKAGDIYQTSMEKMAGVESISFGTFSSALCARDVTSQGTLALDLEGIVDPHQENQRLQKMLLDMDKECTQAQKKLDNQAFIAQAPHEIVEEIRERLAVALEKKEKVQGALSIIRSFL